MQLLLKRSKIFMKGNLRFAEGVGGPYSVPSWAAETETYKAGITDGSIVNLTDKARKQEAELAEVEQREPDAVVEDEATEQPEGHKLQEPPQPVGLQNARGKGKR